MSRPDLLALTPDSLASLANRGLVKRAAKDLDAGRSPEITVAADLAVHGRFADGTQTTLPPGAGLEAATCTCAATGVCRHQLGVVLAYQRQAPQNAPEPSGEPAGPEFADWSPGSFDDEALSRVLGERPLTAARRALRGGYAARIHRPTEADPVAAVELAACTVRFLVPGELGYVHTDAATPRRAEVIVLAVWAFRVADERGLTGVDVRVDVGGTSTATGSGLESALELAGELLTDGAMHAGPVLGTALRRTARDLTARDLHWPAAALEDLAVQLDGYGRRDALYEPERFAYLLTEIYARHRAAAHDGGSPRSQVLGSDEPAETPLRRVRLAALGCRIGGTAERRTADVYLAHPGSGIVLVLKRDWKVTDDEPLTGAELAVRRVSGATLRSFATANIISETASRSAGRVVRLAAGRVAKSTVTPIGNAWEQLPGTLLTRDLGVLDEALTALPPRLIRPRVAAELVRVVEVAEVRDLGYDPGGQRLEATIADRGGATARLSAVHSPYSPGRLDVLAEALSGGPLFVSGTVRRAKGTLMLDPIAVMTSGGVVVPDLAPGGGGALDGYAWNRSDQLTEALEAALAVCADAAHRGLGHVPASRRTRIESAAKGLADSGLRAAAEALRALGAALGGDDGQRTADAWLDAQLRLLTTIELR